MRLFILFYFIGVEFFYSWGPKIRYKSLGKSRSLLLFFGILIGTLLLKFQAQKLGTKMNEKVFKPTAAKATELKEKMKEKVVQPTKQKMKEGKLFENVSTSVSSWATKANKKS